MPPSPLKYAAASVSRPVWPAYAHAPKLHVVRPREEEHRPHRVARVRERVRPLADHEADAPALAAEHLPEDEADDGAVEERVREAEAGPAAVELGGVVRLQVPRPRWIP